MYHQLDTNTTAADGHRMSMHPFSLRFLKVAVRLARSGKSASTFTVKKMLKDDADLYTSLTLASMHRRAKQFRDYYGHLIIDDLGAEKSLWSRTATITTIANLVHEHFIQKLTMSYEIKITNFQGSASLNVQPILMNSLVQGDDWISVVRDKVLRMYHLVRPLKPKRWIPTPEIDWSTPFSKVKTPKSKGQLWWQLIAIGLTQWSHARCLEHIPALLKGCAALDGRLKVKVSDYRLLIKLLKPMQLERYIISTYGFETGRNFQNNIYCLLVELVSHGNPTVEVICEDYKVSPTTVERIVKTCPDWVWLKAGKHKRVMPTKQTIKILETIGANQKW